jgi:hypothetical protein
MICLSHCNVRICLSHFYNKAMLDTLQQSFKSHSMKGLWLSHCHVSKCSTHCDDRDMFITLDYLCHIGLCLSHYDDRSMFVTLQRYYVCLNVKLL